MHSVREHEPLRYAFGDVLPQHDPAARPSLLVLVLLRDPNRFGDPADVGDERMRGPPRAILAVGAAVDDRIVEHVRRPTCGDVLSTHGISLRVPWEVA